MFIMIHFEDSMHGTSHFQTAIPMLCSPAFNIDTQFSLYLDSSPYLYVPHWTGIAL